MTAELPVASEMRSNGPHFPEASVNGSPAAASAVTTPASNPPDTSTTT